MLLRGGLEMNMVGVQSIGLADCMGRCGACQERGGAIWAERKLGHLWFGRGECLLDTLLPFWGHAPPGYCVALLPISLGALLRGPLTGKTFGPTAPTSVPTLSYLQACVG